jgi:hypothetical protein
LSLALRSHSRWKSLVRLGVGRGKSATRVRQASARPTKTDEMQVQMLSHNTLLNRLLSIPLDGTIRSRDTVLKPNVIYPYFMVDCPSSRAPGRYIDSNARSRDRERRAALGRGSAILIGSHKHGKHVPKILLRIIAGIRVSQRLSLPRVSGNRNQGKQLK